MNILFENIALNGGFPSAREQQIASLPEGGGSPSDVYGSMKAGSIDEMVEFFYNALEPAYQNERNRSFIKDTLAEEIGRGNFPNMDFSEEDLVDLNNLLSVQGDRINTQIESALSQVPDLKGLSSGELIRKKRDIIEKGLTGQEALEDQYGAGIYKMKGKGVQSVTDWFAKTIRPNLMEQEAWDELDEANRWETEGYASPQEYEEAQWEAQSGVDRPDNLLEWVGATILPGGHAGLGQYNPLNMATDYLLGDNYDAEVSPLEALLGEQGTLGDSIFGEHYQGITGDRGIGGMIDRQKDKWEENKERGRGWYPGKYVSKWFK